jgi:hypothetical protein
MAMKNEVLSEVARREGEVLARFKNALKDKRLVMSGHVDLNSLSAHRYRLPTARGKPQSDFSRPD